MIHYRIECAMVRDICTVLGKKCTLLCFRGFFRFTRYKSLSMQRRHNEGSSARKGVVDAVAAKINLLLLCGQGFMVCTVYYIHSLIFCLLMGRFHVNVLAKVESFAPANDAIWAFITNLERDAHMRMYVRLKFVTNINVEPAFLANKHQWKVHFCF